MAFASILFSAVLLTNSVQIASAVGECRVDADFALEANVVYHFASGVKKFVLRDGAGQCTIHPKLTTGELLRFADGDLVRATGRIEWGEGTTHAFAVAYGLRRLAGGTQPSPVAVTAGEIAGGNFCERLVSVRGTVIDAFLDELDSNFSWIVLRMSDGDVFVAIPGEKRDAGRLRSLIDSQVSVVGFCGAGETDVGRKFLGCSVMTRDLDAVEVLRPPPQNPFDVEWADDLAGVSAARLLHMGRRRVEGRVLAVWSGKRILVKCNAGCLHDIEVSESQTPAYGDYVQVIGFPETDLYKINLSRAYWRKVDSHPFEEPSAEEKDIRDIMEFSRLGICGIDTKYHGRRLSISGTVERIPVVGDIDQTIGLKSDRYTIPVDIQSCPEVLRSVSVGCVISVIGTCLLRTENCGPNVVLPRVSSCTLALCRPQDIRVVRRPPWWTVRTLLVVIGMLLAVLLGILVWNRILGRIVERKGWELLRSRVERDEADLRTEERMRLAVELHDTVSQELTGVAMLIDAARLAVASDVREAQARLVTACQRMRACRKDLRNCLWDLRNRPFDLKSFAEAVRLTCEPVVGEARLKVDCGISCHDLSSNTAHAVLCIIRELVSNAVRHGRAKRIGVIVSRVNGNVNVHVSDDGSGFCSNGYPGPAEGHFGILGVSERVNRLSGRMKIESLQGQGVCITIEGLNPES